MSMNVTLGPLEEYVREKVAQGEYSSVNEMLCEGLRLMQKREERWKAKIQEKIEVGLEQARQGKSIPGEQAFATLRAWCDEEAKKLNL